MGEADALADVLSAPNLEHPLPTNHLKQISMIGYVDSAMMRMVSPTPDAKLVAMVPEAMEQLRTVSPGLAADRLACAQAALYLLADDLERCHRICQDVPSNLGSAWHAAMHRREGDFSNSGYWWRRAGPLPWQNPLDGQPLHVEVASLARAVGDAASQAFAAENADAYSPDSLTGQVEKHRSDFESPWYATLVRVLRLEWLSLFAETTR